MGQKVSPIGFRVGVFRGWSARWFAHQGSYAKNVMEDLAIRKVLADTLPRFDTVDILIDRTGDIVRVTLFSTAPGAVIGKKGQGVEVIRDNLSKRFNKRVEFVVKEAKNSDLSAAAIAGGIAEQIEKRVNFKKAMKKAGFVSMKAGALGIKICCSGRLGGAEIARSEWLRQGSVPLHTLRSNVDYSLVVAKTLQGLVGVKVWICRGEF